MSDAVNSRAGRGDDADDVVPRRSARPRSARDPEPSSMPHTRPARDDRSRTAPQSTPDLDSDPNSGVDPDPPLPGWMVPERPAAANAAEVPAAAPVATGRNLPIAIAVGVVLGAVLIGSLFWHPMAFTLVIAVFVVLANVEAGAELRAMGITVSVPPLLLGGMAIVLGAYRSGHAGQAVGILVLFLGTVAWLLADPHRTDVVRNLTLTLMLGLWTAYLASFGVLLIGRESDGPVAVLAVAGAAVFGDIGGYAVGVRFGRRKIAPRVSPNKSVEGLIGGLVVASVLAALVLPQIGDLFTVPTAIAIAVVSVLAGFLGDLTESMIKRDLGIKDFGRVLPGHGGVLDRVDGLLVALPIGFFAITLLT